MLKLFRNCLLAVTVLLVSTDAFAVIRIEIDEGVVVKVPIAIVPFGQSPDNVLDPLDYSLDQVIRSDLERSGLFEPIQPDLFLSHPSKSEDIDFVDWKLIQVDYLLIGTVELQDDKYRVVSRLYDVLGQQQIFGVQYIVGQSQLRQTVHRIANKVFESITGRKSSFHTQILYTTTRQENGNGLIHSLFYSDYDGHNPQKVLESNYPIFSPTWSPDSKQIAYSLLEPDRSRIYVQTLGTGAREVIAEFKGHNRSPNWSPDGRMIAFTLSRGGNSDIYILDLKNRKLRQLTRNTQIDTEASWSPDGEHIIFTSNRGKNAQIYRKSLSPNSRSERVTIAGKSNSGARYHPSGNELALITSESGSSRVAIYDLKSNALKVVSSTYIDDSINFSPHGDMLIYVVEGQDRHLRILSPDGSTQSRIAVNGGVVKQVSWETNQ